MPNCWQRAASPRCSVILVRQAEEMAASLGGKLQPPKLSWKYSWIAALFGRQQAKRAQIVLPRMKWSLIRRWEKIRFQIEGRKFDESFLKSA